MSGLLVSQMDILSGCRVHKLSCSRSGVYGEVDDGMALPVGHEAQMEPCFARETRQVEGPLALVGQRGVHEDCPVCSAVHPVLDPRQVLGRNALDGHPFGSGLHESVAGEVDGYRPLWRPFPRYRGDLVVEQGDCGIVDGRDSGFRCRLPADLCAVVDSDEADSHQGNGEYHGEDVPFHGGTWARLRT